MPDYPDLDQVNDHMTTMRKILRDVGVPVTTINAIATRSLRTGRKTTGPYATNRDPRWSRAVDHPQYGTERDCKVIFVKLAAQIFCFDNAPSLPDDLRQMLEQNYLGHPIAAGAYRDKLLLERFDFVELVKEGLKPTHGHSGFHMGHEDPSLKPKHTPDNVGWRSYRSNLIQGNMTLREARIYFLKLIGRYFELGEIEIAGEAPAEVAADLVVDEEE